MWDGEVHGRDLRSYEALHVEGCVGYVVCCKGYDVYCWEGVVVGEGGMQDGAWSRDFVARYRGGVVGLAGMVLVVWRVEMDVALWGFACLFEGMGCAVESMRDVREIAVDEACGLESVSGCGVWGWSVLCVYGRHEVAYKFAGWGLAIVWTVCMM
jgi:hypothetical protein